MLSIWEAQFGDFANMAQVMFDNFISSARSKWGQKSGLVMLITTWLSKVKVQSTLQAVWNVSYNYQLKTTGFVANCSNAANYYHLLRRQARMLGTEGVRPLVVVTPKSLLRHPLAAASAEELSKGKFQEVIEQPGLR